MDQTAVLEPFSIGAHAVRRSELRRGETVLVIGAGLIGSGVFPTVVFDATGNVRSMADSFQWVAHGGKKARIRRYGESRYFILLPRVS